MMFTDLSYIDFGGVLATFSILFFTVVVVIRFVLAFRNYIQTGSFGDFEKSLFGEIMENGNFFTIYAFTGYHPGILLMDAVVLALFSFLMIPLWSLYMVGGLFLLLGNIMRKRIAIKQEFVAKLDGTHNDD